VTLGGLQIGNAIGYGPKFQKPLQVNAPTDARPTGVPKNSVTIELYDLMAKATNLNGRAVAVAGEVRCWPEQGCILLESIKIQPAEEAPDGLLGFLYQNCTLHFCQSQLAGDFESNESGPTLYVYQERIGP
jgi:hypothetical protein